MNDEDAEQPPLLTMRKLVKISIAAVLSWEDQEPKFEYWESVADRYHTRDAWSRKTSLSSKPAPIHAARMTLSAKGKISD